MKKQLYISGLLSAALMISACDGSDGSNGANGVDGSDGSDGFNSLVAVRDVPVGDAVCLGGGQALGASAADKLSTAVSTRTETAYSTRPK